MKKILLASAVLTIFSISLTLFQFSCKKDATAQTGSTYTLPPASTSSLGGVIVGNGLAVTGNGTLSVTSQGTGLTQLNKIAFSKDIYVGTVGHGEIWTANYDGTGQVQVNVSLPTGEIISTHADTRLSPDGNTIFFTVNKTSNNSWHIYSCKLDGTNVKKVIDGTGSSYILIGGAN